MKSIFVLAFAFFIAIDCYSQASKNQDLISQVTLSNSIQYSDTSFTDLPGNGFLIEFGDEILAVTCKHALWANRPKGMKTIDFQGKLNEWKMVVINDSSQYVILGDLINTNNNESIGERNTDKDYLVFRVKKNHSKVQPLKLSMKPVQVGDTLFQVGWTYQTKTSVAELHMATAYGYLGPSLLSNYLVHKNYAGLSGSPVINKNNELVAIVSTWKFDMASQKWFNAPCSIDYLWEVLYSYWLTENQKEKSLSSFQEFLSFYKKRNGNKLEVSSYLYSELFYNDWLKSKGYKYGSIEKFSQWTSGIMDLYGIKIIADDYRKTLLIFDGWKEAYSVGKMEIVDLEQLFVDAKVSLPDLINFYEYSQELSAIKKYDKAIAILMFADEKIQHMGQLYAFLGDAYLAKGEKELAKEAYLKCLKTYPEFPQAMDGLMNLKKYNH